MNEPSDIPDELSAPDSSAPVAPAADLDAPEPSKPSPVKRFFWQGKIGPAFWTIASLISLVVNIILFIILFVLGSQIFKIKAIVGDQLIGGLYGNFVQMDEANIITTIHVSDTIQVKDTIPVVFNLPLKQETEVVLTRDASIRRATVFLNGAPVPTDIILKRGTKLNIFLDMIVPVNQTIPVELNVPVQLTVPVDIPLNETELHQPFVGLQEVLSPYKILLDQTPDSWGELFCSLLPGALCK